MRRLPVAALALAALLVLLFGARFVGEQLGERIRPSTPPAAAAPVDPAPSPAPSVPAPAPANPTPAPAEPGPEPVPQPPAPPPHPPAAPKADGSEEFRGVWIVAWEDMVSPEKVAAAVAKAKAANFNALIVQVRARGDAYYESVLVPRAEALAGQDPAFDPLAELIRLAKPAGLQVHAWMNAYLVWSHRDRAPKDVNHVFNARPDWLLRDANGVVHGTETPSTKARHYEGGFYLNPAHPLVQQHLHAVCMEVVDNYAIDGLHLDYVRYPARTGREAVGVDYSPTTLSRFKALTGLEPREHTAEWDQWRADQITALIRNVHKSVRERRPGMALSAAVLAAWDIAIGRNYTDHRSWLREGVIDYVFPMAYSKDPGYVADYAQAAHAAYPGSRSFAGLGAYLLSPADLASQISAVRKTGAKGFVVFALHTLDDAFIQRLVEGPLAQPVRAPRLTAIPAGESPGPLPRPVEPVSVARLQGTGSGVSLTVKRQFYVRAGRTTLRIDNAGMQVLRLVINGRTIPDLAVPVNGQLKLDISIHVDPAWVDWNWDQHTSDIELEVYGKAGQSITFTVEDRY